MSEHIKFVCTKCGGTAFKTTTEVKTFEDLIGATCATCGTLFTEDDIKAQALKIAEDAARNAFGDNGKIHLKIGI